MAKDRKHNLVVIAVERGRLVWCGHTHRDTAAADKCMQKLHDGSNNVYLVRAR